jgi:hydroxyacylglutathione hydrolase
MLQIKSFTLGPFAENTYLVWDSDTLDCAIFDPGCSDAYESKIIDEFILQQNLLLKQLIQTHCHIDHVLGNHHICDKYGLNIMAHQAEVLILQEAQAAAILYHIPYQASPTISTFINENDSIKIGQYSLEIRFTPGHSPGSLTFISNEFKWAIVGDVIFRQSIGRTDLTGGSFEVLQESITHQIYTLPEDYTLFSGHGPETQVGFEKIHNAFVKG